jgi:hypothetical protein
MPTPALIPIHVDALPVEGAAPLTVPGQDPAKPFVDVEPLEPGVHLHWALPDGLTRGAHENAADPFLRFPAVPDLWLIVRWNPPPPARKASERVPAGTVIQAGLTLSVDSRRSYHAWVLDALTRVATPLDSWTPPDPASKRLRLTAVGELDQGQLLPRATPDEVQNRLFDGAYYPASRNRFGFYDSLAGAGPGPYSYVVVGWYARLSEDPLHAAGNDEARRAWAQARRWDLPWMCRAGLPTSLFDGVAQGIPLPSLQLEDLQLNPMGPVGQVLDYQVLVDVQSQLIAGLGSDVRVSTGPVVGMSPLECHPDRIFCHGTVIDVAWNGGGGALRGKSDPAPVPELIVSPSLYAAAADGFANGGLDEVVQALELNLGGEMGGGTDAARQGLAHRLHAAAFASHSGGQDDAWFVEQTAGQTGSILGQRLGFEGTTPVTLAGVPQAVKELTVRDLALRQALAKQLGGGDPAVEASIVKRTVFTRAEVQTLTAVPALQGKVAAFHAYVPRPRFYKPVAPVVLLSGCGRAWRYGQDGRLDPERFDEEASGGFLRCRDGYGVVTGLSITLPKIAVAPEVNADDVVGDGPSLAAVPATAAALVREASLVDPPNAALMARLWLARAGLTGQALLDRLDEATAAFEVEMELWWGLADVEAGADLESEILDASRYVGTLPSPIAVTPWREPWAPLFAECRWEYVPLDGGAVPGLPGPWTLGEVDWQPSGAPKLGAAKPLMSEERCLLSVAVADLLVGTVARTMKLVVETNGSVHPNGPAAVARTDVLSCALAQLERTLADAGAGVRAGWLRLERLRLVDVFGQTRMLIDKHAPVGSLDVRRASEDQQALAALDPALPAHALLRPRLPYWSRLQLRFTPPQPAGATSVRGFLLPDLVEHGVELFDQDGQGLGQLVHRRAEDGSTEVRWEAHPWAAVVDAAADPLAPGRVVADPLLEGLVEGILKQPAAPNGESALAAMLRAMDTTRLAVERRANRSASLGRIAGRPVALVSAALSLETAAVATDPSTNPTPTPPPVGVQARLGSLTQLDDGLLGWLVDTDLAAFHPVDAAVRQIAVASGPYSGFQGDAGAPATRPIDHPYVSPQDRLTLSVGTPVGLLLLMDPHSALYATCGVLPRKRLALPEEQVETTEALGPSFRCAPVLLRPDAPALPLPVVADRTWEWVRAEDGGWSRLPAAAATDAASVDPRPARIEDGWLRLTGA